MESVACDLTDNELWRLIQGGSPWAEARLVERYRVIAVGMAKRFSVHRMDREDLVAVAMGGFVKGLKTYQEGRGANFSTWTRPIMKNRLQDAYRTAARKGQVPVSSEVSIHLPGKGDRPREFEEVIPDDRRFRSAYEDLEARAEANDFLRTLCAEMRTSILAALAGSDVGCAGMWRKILRKRAKGFVGRRLAKKVAEQIDFGADIEANGQFALFGGGECAPGARTVALADRIVPKIVDTIFDAFERLEEGETLQQVGDSIGLSRRELDQIVRSVRAAALALA